MEWLPATMLFCAVAAKGGMGVQGRKLDRFVSRRLRNCWTTCRGSGVKVGEKRWLQIDEDEAGGG